MVRKGGGVVYRYFLKKNIVMYIQFRVFFAAKIWYFKTLSLFKTFSIVHAHMNVSGINMHLFKIPYSSILDKRQ